MRNRTTLFTAQHSTAQHSTAQHSTAQGNCALFCGKIAYCIRDGPPDLVGLVCPVRFGGFVG